METARQIILAFQLPEALPGVLEGISRFVREHQCNWRVLLCVDGHDFRAALSGQIADGAITGLGPRSQAILAALRRTRTPVVNVIRDLVPRIPSVLSDNPAIGAAAADYLLERGFRRFGFVGVELPWSRERFAGFAARLAHAGDLPLAKLQLPLKDYQYASKLRATKLVRKWLRQLSPRTAIMGAADFIARTVINAAAAEGFAVPADFAVIGVDNFPSECQIGPVTLTSVAQDFQRIGFEAAALLHGIMHRREWQPRRPLLVPPGKIHVRTSTDVLAFEDPVVLDALRIINERAPAGLTMKELLDHVPLSRKWLDHRFKQVVGRTPSDEIRRRRLARVCDLLTETEMPLRQIAARGRFSCVQNMIRCFRRAYQCSPQAYRRSAREIASTTHTTV